MIYGWFSAALFLFSSLFAPSFLSTEKTYSFTEKVLYHTCNIIEKACLTLTHFEILNRIFDSSDLLESLDSQHGLFKEEQSKILKKFNLKLGDEISEPPENTRIFWKLKNDIQPALYKLSNDPEFQELDLTVKACALHIVESAHKILPQKSFSDSSTAEKWNEMILGEYQQHHCLEQLSPFDFSQKRIEEISVVFTSIDHLLQIAFYSKKCPILFASLTQGLDFFRNAFHTLPVESLRSIIKLLFSQKHWILKIIPTKEYIKYNIEKLFYEIFFDTISNIWEEGALESFMSFGYKIGFLTCKNILNTAVWLTKKNLFLDTSITILTCSLQYYWIGANPLLVAESFRLIKRWISDLCGQKKPDPSILKEMDLLKAILEDQSKASNVKIEKPYDFKQNNLKEKDEEHEKKFAHTIEKGNSIQKFRPQEEYSQLYPENNASRNDLLLSDQPFKQ